MCLRLLVRRPPPSDLTTAVGHVPLEQSTIEWLQGKSGVLAVAPKVENNPQLLSLATLSAPGGASEPLPLFGAIGIEPAAEASITHINEAIVEGDYLGVQGGYSILISRKAAEKLEVRPGDELLLTTGIVE
jgi:ABC-type lipoprotein release transport system permease subunit